MTLVPAASHPALREIPSVERCLQRLAHHPAVGRLANGEPRRRLRDLVRAVLAQVREELVRNPPGTAVTSEEIALRVEREVVDRFERQRRMGLRPVINATGVILHTNLGRAPLPAEAVRAVADIASGYSNLEYNLESGNRGQRHVHCEVWLKDLLGCASAVVVNNCAASVLLTLDTFCQGGEVIISRGELIEIGGGFRIPEVMRKSGAVLKEVGTTNRTRLADYEEAMTPETRMILRVHPSNFRLVGFSEAPALADLAALAKRHGLICYEDLGSGALVDLSVWGVDEPLARNSLAAGVDLVTFSGDKLLGGPQAGIIAGRQDLLDAIRKNPLMRALRVDKLTYAALEATLRLYAEGRALHSIPTLAALAASPEQVLQRATGFLRRLRRAVTAAHVTCEAALKPGHSLVGGGSAPQVQLPTTLIALRHAVLSAAELEARLRSAPTPVIARVEDDWVLLDLRAVPVDHEKTLLEMLLRIL